jgi:hypothetical protein
MGRLGSARQSPGGLALRYDPQRIQRDLDRALMRRRVPASGRGRINEGWMAVCVIGFVLRKLLRVGEE